MARPEGDNPIQSAMRAFDSVPKDLRVRTGAKLAELPLLRKRDALTLHIVAGMGYLARYPDAYLQRVAGSVDQTFRDYLANRAASPFLILVTGRDNSARAGQDGEEANPLRIDVTRAFIPEEGKMAVVFQTPVEFVFAAETPDASRIDALGQIAYAASKFQSIVDGSVDTYPAAVEEWAEVTEAHFYNLVGLQPGIELSDRAREIAAKYPNGIYTLPLDSRPPGFTSIDRIV